MTRNPHVIFKAVSDFYGVEVSVMRGPRRSKSVALARYVGVFLLRRFTPMSMVEVGEFVGDRDHSSISKAMQHFASLMAGDSMLQMEVSFIQDRIREAA
jgi:chromosomal replication initiator protein